jgi:pyruvate kinase
MIINHKKTKIVATLGPASDSLSTMTDMVKAGVNVFRINMSHATREMAALRAERVKQINARYGTNIAILADLQGPKLRVGEVEEGVELTAGDEITFTNTPCIGNASRVYMTYKEFARDVKVGERILVDDGKIVLDVIHTNGIDEVTARVVQGGSLRSRKGVNLPNTQISLPALTEKDKEDVKTAIEIGVDWFALSFVRSGEDIQLLRDEIARHTSKRIPIVSKIEKPEAVEDIDTILQHTDAIMVARGDLGIEIPAESVPLVQKMLVKKARTAAKPIIIATQMMESMTHSLTPSRSDVNDVANSVMDGADAVMLSGETAMGEYPVDVIEQMTKIIRNIERHNSIDNTKNPPSDESRVRFMTDAICYHASQIAIQLSAKAISTITNSGYTAYQISSHRPNAHILVYTSNRDIMTQLNLVWGCRAFYYKSIESTDQAVDDINAMGAERGFVAAGERVVNLMTTPLNEKGHVNTLRISTVKDL